MTAPHRADLDERTVPQLTMPVLPALPELLEFLDLIQRVRARTHHPRTIFGGTGQWAPGIEDALGGDVGQYCAHLGPDVIEHIISALVLITTSTENCGPPPCYCPAHTARKALNSLAAGRSPHPCLEVVPSAPEAEGTSNSR